jgi:hypothetical protein
MRNSKGYTGKNKPMPKVSSKWPAEVGKRLLREYTKDTKAFLENICTTGGDLVVAMESLSPIEVESEEDYVTYEREFIDYTHMLSSCREMLLSDGSEKTRETYVITMQNIHVPLYNVWTCRLKQYSARIRQSTKRISEWIERAIKEAIGDDISWYFIALAERVSDFKICWCFMIPLKFACGYDLEMAITDRRLTRCLARQFQQLEKKPAADEISSAIELFETLGSFKKGNEIMEPINEASLRDVEEMAKVILRLRNEELFEVCLRKKLFPSCMYDWLIRQARNLSPPLLPCLIAYKSRTISEQ